MSGLLKMQGLLMRGGGGSGFLDQLAVPVAVLYSLKKLGSAANSAVRVRRSSDNAEMNVGFVGSTVGSALNVAAMLVWAGSDSVYVKTWYDQSGGARHLTQSTNSKQPRIANAGVYEGIAKWDGINDALSALAVPLDQQAMGLFLDGVVPVANNPPQIVVEASADWNSNQYSWIFYTYQNRWDAGMNSDNPAIQRIHGYSGLAMGTRKIMSILFRRSLPADTSINAWSAGTPRTNTVVAVPVATGSFATHDIYVGGRAGTSLFNACQIFTLAIFNGNVSTLRSGIEATMAL